MSFSTQRYTFVIVTLIATVGLIAAGCAQLPAAPGVPTLSPTPGPWKLARADVQRVITADVPQGDLAELVAGNSAFAFDLYHAIREGEGNLFYSPYSISVALAMTYAGARGETEQQMADTLQYTLPQDDLHPAFNALDHELASRGEATDDNEEQRFQLNIANAIWGQVDYSFLSEFLDTLARNYGAGLRLLDFASEPEESRAIINDWVSDATEGKIKDLLQPGVIDPSTRLVLTNAIYFNALWQLPFRESATQDGTFTLLDGGQVAVPMMSQTEQFAYAEGDGYQAIGLPYRGAPVSMVVLLPAEGRFEEFEQSLDAERVDAILEQLEPEGVELTMPKFEYDARLNLTETLSDMGMPAAFGGEADFSGITGDRSLFISDVVHKAFVSVDEEGTEAAAATAVVMREAAVISEIEMKIDRPFIFMIRDNETDTLLFLGRVVNPTS